MPLSKKTGKSAHTKPHGQTEEHFSFPAAQPVPVQPAFDQKAKTQNWASRAQQATGSADLATRAREAAFAADGKANKWAQRGADRAQEDRTRQQTARDRVLGRLETLQNGPANDAAEALPSMGQEWAEQEEPLQNRTTAAPRPGGFAHSAMHMQMQAPSAAEVNPWRHSASPVLKLASLLYQQYLLAGDGGCARGAAPPGKARRGQVGTPQPRSRQA